MANCKECGAYWPCSPEEYCRAVDKAFQEKFGAKFAEHAIKIADHERKIAELSILVDSLVDKVFCTKGID